MTVIGRFARTASRFVPAALARPLAGATAVFFHGVERGTVEPQLQSTQHALEDFVEIAETLKRNHDVLPLGELTRVLKNPQRHKRAVFLMSDDGYANTLTNAADVLADHKLPWTLFVSSYHIDTGDLVPLLTARTFFEAAPAGRYNIPNLGAITLNFDRTMVSLRVCETLKTLDAVRAREALVAMKEILSRVGKDNIAQRYPSECFLTWPQVAALKKRGVEIGAHADTHWAMHGGQSDSYLRLQAERPKQRIESEIGRCRFFAYPFGNRGDIGEKAWRAVRDAGYEYAFTTIAGTLDASTNPWLLPRYGLSSRESSLSSVLPMMRANNARLRQWQSRIGT